MLLHVHCLGLIIIVAALIIGLLSIGDKDSKKKQKSPASSGQAQQVVVMRELKWDHQVCTLYKFENF